MQIATPLSIETAGGTQKINCANTEGIFRIIQSIPSPKAEPFKRWLAEVGYERVQEIEDPELATKRTRATTEITQTDNSQGFDKLKQDAKDGGMIAGDAKRALEKKTGKRISTSENYLDMPEIKKRLK